VALQSDAIRLYAEAVGVVAHPRDRRADVVEHPWPRRLAEQPVLARHRGETLRRQQRRVSAQHLAIPALPAAAVHEQYGRAPVVLRIGLVDIEPQVAAVGLGVRNVHPICHRSPS
jgi:hypothetical protein